MSILLKICYQLLVCFLVLHMHTKGMTQDRFTRSRYARKDKKIQIGRGTRSESPYNLEINFLFAIKNNRYFIRYIDNLLLFAICLMFSSPMWLCLLPLEHLQETFHFLFDSLFVSLYKGYTLHSASHSNRPSTLTSRMTW